MRRPISMRHKYLMSLLLLIVPLIIVPIIGIRYTSEMFEKTMTSLYQVNLRQIAGSMNFVIDDIISSSNLLAMDEDIISVLDKDSEFAYRFEKTKKVMEAFKKVEAANLYSFNVDLILMDMNHNIYDNSIHEYRKPVEYEDIASQHFFQEMIMNKKTLYWITSPEDFSFPEKIPFTGGITLARLLFHKNTSHISGMLIINVSPNQNFKNILYSSSFENYLKVFITDDAGNIIVSTAPVPSVDKDGTLFLKEPLSKVSWYIVGEIPYRTLMKDYLEYNRFQIGLNICFLLLTAFAVYLLSGYITKPIMEINLFVKEITKGDYSKRLHISDSYELQALSNTLNSMLDETNRLLNDIESITREKERSRTRILQAQLTPHFLLNTLNGIKWLCNIEGAKSAEKMIVSLGYLLEHTLNTDRDFIPLSEEIACLNRYVDLQHMRYGYIFRFETDIKEDAADIPVPILILQPLVENCIIHAFDGIDYIGIIRISAVIENNFLIILVSDNGIGIDNDWYNRSTEFDSREHIGIKNVLERIRLYYYDDGNVSISRKQEGGTIVTITIPVYSLRKEDSYESVNCR